METLSPNPARLLLARGIGRGKSLTSPYGGLGRSLPLTTSLFWRIQQTRHLVTSEFRLSGILNFKGRYRRTQVRSSQDPSSTYASRLFRTVKDWPPFPINRKSSTRPQPMVIL